MAERDKYDKDILKALQRIVIPTVEEKKEIEATMRLL